MGNGFFVPKDRINGVINAKRSTITPTPHQKIKRIVSARSTSRIVVVNKKRIHELGHFQYFFLFIIHGACVLRSRVQSIRVTEGDVLRDFQIGPCDAIFL